MNAVCGDLPLLYGFPMTRHYPFTAIVGQNALVTALKIVAIDPAIGGVLAFGDRGTGKSTALRGCFRRSSLMIATIAAILSGRGAFAPNAGPRSRPAKRLT